MGNSFPEISQSDVHDEGCVQAGWHNSVGEERQIKRSLSVCGAFHIVTEVMLSRESSIYWAAVMGQFCRAIALFAQKFANFAPAAAELANSRIDLLHR
ncbi:hypothetical protein [Leptolyngbya iicbica]|uniref:Uncharacterized protein n=2 Tax=Cyanophyceae TaxID=3028117 RepID=A0A4Q7E365_9CYAN|nr:hypothetical protein [Leptolyngbya sp. LK]RZM75968.1 hypothetical protein DYY88_18890 [Leptolyngbya sp. LK]